MRLKKQTTFAAVGLTALLSTVSLNAMAIEDRHSEQEREPEQRLFLPQLQNFYDDFMRKVVKEYREFVAAIDSAIKEDDELTQVVADKRAEVRDEAIGRELRRSPELMRTTNPRVVRNAPPPTYSPAPTPQPKPTPRQQPRPEPKPQPQPQPEPKPQPQPQPEQPKPQPQPQPEPKPQPEPQPQPQPEPKPQPEPQPQPEPKIGSAKLSWNVPNKRENGDRLQRAEISSYEIYVTAENAGTSRTIRVDNSSQTSFTLEPLAADTYYFSMVTIDSDGVYSELSQVVSKTIN